MWVKKPAAATAAVAYIAPSYKCMLGFSIALSPPDEATIDISLSSVTVLAATSSSARSMLVPKTSKNFSGPTTAKRSLTALASVAARNFRMSAGPKMEAMVPDRRKRPWMASKCLAPKTSARLKYKENFLVKLKIILENNYYYPFIIFRLIYK